MKKRPFLLAIIVFLLVLVPLYLVFRRAKTGRDLLSPDLRESLPAFSKRR